MPFDYVLKIVKGKMIVLVHDNYSVMSMVANFIIMLFHDREYMSVMLCQDYFPFNALV